MRTFIKTILDRLDGTPTADGKRQAGQSVVELALITPILIVMLVGLTEIGWFANNYLNLLDVTRAGARRATTFTDQLDPLVWDNTTSYVPTGSLPSSAYAMPENATNGTNADRLRSRNYDPSTGLCTESVTNYFDAIGFYDSVVCIMLRSMPPLIMDPNNDVDDIVISGFGLARVNPADNDASLPVGGSNPPWLGPNRAIAADIPQMVVVSRFPSNANECDVTLDAGGAAAVTPLEPRDPFDFNENNLVDRNPTASEPALDVVTEILNEYNEVIVSFENPGYDATAANVTDAEKQIGFVWFGNHVIEGTNCVGSEWTMLQIEQLMNLPNFSLESPFGPTDQSRREMLPNQGVVIVEMFWQHRLLLNLPFFTALGDLPTISVWAAFPLPTIEPYIVFP
ncbi:MAG: TadE family protein [Chloroflexota bacterium]|nr:TadE family protein [Chloroflexota bacterium]